MISSRAHLFEVLSTNGWEEIPGSVETDWLDFKRDPYPVHEPKGVADFVADVAAFANHRGGVIALGVSEHRSEGTMTAVADTVLGVPAALVNPEQLRMLAAEHIQPLVHLDIRKYELADDRVIVAIDVEAAAAYERPCIVSRVTGAGTAAHGFGWPMRHGATTHWESARRIQQLISTGMNPGTERREVAPSLTAAIDEHGALKAGDSEWNAWPQITIQADPVDPRTEINEFFGRFAADLVRWSGLRANGFNLRLHWSPALRSGRSLVAERGDCVTAIHRTGVVTVSALGSPEMLAWSHKLAQPIDETVQIDANPYPSSNSRPKPSASCLSWSLRWSLRWSMRLVGGSRSVATGSLARSSSTFPTDQDRTCRPGGRPRTHSTSQSTLTAAHTRRPSRSSPRSTGLDGQLSRHASRSSGTERSTPALFEVV